MNGVTVIERTTYYTSRNTRSFGGTAQVADRQKSVLILTAIVPLKKCGGFCHCYHRRYLELLAPHASFTPLVEEFPIHRQNREFFLRPCPHRNHQSFCRKAYPIRGPGPLGVLKTRNLCQRDRCDPASHEETPRRKTANDVTSVTYPKPQCESLKYGIDKRFNSNKIGSNGSCIRRSALLETPPRRLLRTRSLHEQKPHHTF